MSLMKRKKQEKEDESIEWRNERRVEEVIMNQSAACEGSNEERINSSSDDVHPSYDVSKRPDQVIIQ